MDGKPKNPEFRNNPENLNPCTHPSNTHNLIFQNSYNVYV